MTEEMKKAELAYLEERWQEETRKIKRYSLALKGAKERRAEIEKRIKEL